MSPRVSEAHRGSRLRGIGNTWWYLNAGDIGTEGDARWVDCRLSEAGSRREAYRDVFTAGLQSTHLVAPGRYANSSATSKTGQIKCSLVRESWKCPRGIRP